MKRASNAFYVLQATAAIVALATILWSLGAMSFNFVEAANVTTISDTLSDSGPSVVSDHTIVFTTPSGVAAGETIVITFPDGASDFDLSTIGAEEIDLASTTGEYSLSNSGASGETWGVSTSTFSITLTSATAVLSPNATVTIKIGTNATYEAGTQTQITNPTVGSYEINVAAGSSDTGATRVAIIAAVTVSASVDTIFNFSVAGVQGNQTVNATTTGGTTTATLIPFGKLDAGTASTAAQDLIVSTNAKNGFVVTVTADGMLRTPTGADIDGFRNGNYETTSVHWEGPTPVLGSEWTYGHWGITSDDATLGSGAASDLYDVGGDGQNYVSASTTPVEVFRHTGPTNGTVTGQGTTRVGYTVEISTLQEAADDYQATLTYVATPVF